MLQLTKNQEKAVTYGNGPLMVIAGPGSGKTFVITMRVKYLIKNLKVEPKSILVLTFSRAAALQMKERFIEYTSKSSYIDTAYDGVTWGTFHAVFFSMIKAVYGYNAAQVLNEDEKYNIIKVLLKQYEPDMEELSTLISQIIQEIALIKQEMIDIRYYYSKSCAADVFREIYKGYGKRLAFIKKIDFEDMLLMAYELLLKRQDIRKAYNERFKYILVDEFQDINRIQYEIVRMLAGNSQNLTVVGDDDQSIYGFRGARPEIMLGFKNDYPNSETILLDINFRSGIHIVNCVQRFISHNKKRFKKEVFASERESRPPEIIEYNSPMHQFKSIIQDIKGYIKSGWCYDDIAVLYRINIQPRLLTKFFMEENIPFTINDTVPDLYSHWISEDIISYIKVANGIAGLNDWLRIINHPNRYIKREALRGSDSCSCIKQLYSYYSDTEYMIKRISELEHNIRVVKSLSTVRAIKYIRGAVGYDDFIREYAYDRGIDDYDFLNILSELEESSSGFKTFKDWFKYIDDYRIQLANSSGLIKTKKSGGVSLMSFHSSKGLEYKIVYILDVNKGIMPYKKAVSKDELEEERRMFYVAMTRARDRLFLCTCKRGFNGKNEPSIFLNELKQ